MTREEAINKVREMNLPKETKEILEALAPELAESEDERIRKEIIDFIQWAEDRGMTRHDYHQAKRPAVWIAYLEKQKETANSFTDGVIEVRSFQRGIAEGRRLERQKECVADSSKTSANEDESIRKFLVDYFTSYKIGNVATKLNGVRIDDILNYLEKQKEPEDVSASTMIPSCWKAEQKSAEWSEEDEKMMNLTKTQLRILQSHLSHAHSKSMSDMEYSSRLLQIEKCVSWLDIRLKSLRPQPHWKPSEEQMEALQRASVNEYLSAEQFDILVCLYEQLKKLGVKEEPEYYQHFDPDC